MKKIIRTLLLIMLVTISKNTVKAADYIWPIDEKNAYETYIEYGYGDRSYDSSAYDKKYNYAPYEGKYSKVEPHFGVDITGIKGNTYDVVSIVDGKVLTTSLDQIYNPSLKYVDRFQRRTTNDGGGYGNYIVIQETKTGKCFLYAHLKANSVTLKNGDNVKKGQKIGVMGSSGDSGHMHLHFEVRPSAKEVLPQFVFGGNKNLVVTYQYNKETLNPVDYIGKNAPKKEEPKIGEGISIKKPDPAEIKNITYTDLGTFGKIVIEYTKAINIINEPTIEVKVGNKTVKANYVSNNGKRIFRYTFKFDEFTNKEKQEIILNINKGNIVNIDDSTVKANYIVKDKLIGYLNPQVIEKQEPKQEIEKEMLLGDLDFDGVIDGSDASIVLVLIDKIDNNEQLTQKELKQKQVADMNKDGKITTQDAKLILKYYAQQGVK